jgi:FkbM family methyltransferase
MLLFDIGANRGDATLVGLDQGYDVIALEPAPRIYSQLVKNFIYNPRVTPLRLAVANQDDQRIEFYEADEDGLSTLNKEWLTSDSLPYAGKPFRTIAVNTITLDSLIERYGSPDLIKIDVEGAEWQVLKGLSDLTGTIALEWTDVTLDDHQDQISYLADLGYTEFAPQFIEHHLQRPAEWYSIESITLRSWVEDNSQAWVEGDWKLSNLRPTADVGMVWVR